MFFEVISWNELEGVEREEKAGRQADNKRGRR